MRPLSVASAALVAAALAGCAHGEAASAASSEIASLRSEVQSLRRDREADKRRLELLEAQLGTLARSRATAQAGLLPGPGVPEVRSAPATRAAPARTFEPPADLAVVRLAPPADEPEDDDSFAFIADGGHDERQVPAATPSRRTGGPDVAPALPIDVELRLPADGNLYDRGLASLEKGDLDQAVSLLERFLSENPRDGRADNAGLALGDALRARKLPGKALEAWQRVITDFPAGDAVPDALFRYGETCLSLGRGAAARAAFQRLAESYPGTDAARRAAVYLADR